MTDLNDSFNLRVLNPKEFKLFRTGEADARVRMELLGDRCVIEVRIARALPLSDPDRYIGLRDGDDKEIGLLHDLHGLEPNTRIIIEEELDRRYLLPRVEKVIGVRDEFGISVWDVLTDHGTRRYTVRNMRDNTVPISPTRLIMTDVDGNRFEFPDVTTVGSKAYDVLLKVL